MVLCDVSIQGSFHGLFDQKIGFMRRGRKENLESLKGWGRVVICLACSLPIESDLKLLFRHKMVFSYTRNDNQ